MILGNIVSNGSLEQDDNFKYYSFGETIINDEIPTLYIGYKETLSVVGPDVELNSLERQIDSKHLWTFSKNENNKYMVNDLFNFKILCHYNFINKLVYCFVNPFDNRQKLYKVIGLINKNNNIKITQFNDGMIYVYCDKYVFGIDLNFMSFYGFNTDKLISKLKGKSTKYIVESEIPEDILLFNDIIETKKFTPFLI